MKLSNYEKCGIYKITNMINHRIYIGQSADIYGRWSSHIKMLKKGEHHCSPLQYDFTRHGMDSFLVDIVELCPKIELKKNETKCAIRLYSIGHSLYNFEVYPQGGILVAKISTSCDKDIVIWRD